jgi:hypothetical protein
MAMCEKNPDTEVAFLCLEYVTSIVGDDDDVWLVQQPKGLLDSARGPLITQSRAKDVQQYTRTSLGWLNVALNR